MSLHLYSQNVLVILVLFIAGYVQSSSATNQCLNFCSSGGACLKTKNGPKCICSPEWTGERCDIRQKLTLTEQMRISQVANVNLRDNRCSLAPEDVCNYNGVCYVLDGRYACHCNYPFIGQYCENDQISECFGHCMNDGICILISDFPICTCMPGWTGVRCQTRITTATARPTIPATTTNIPCNLLPPGYCNSGICIVGSRARCVCPPPYTGNRCEILIGPTTSTTESSSGLPTITLPTITLPIVTTPYTNCGQNPCQNNGQCFRNGNTYFCFCRAPYTGRNCESIVG